MHSTGFEGALSRDQRTSTAIVQVLDRYRRSAGGLRWVRFITAELSQPMITSMVFSKIRTAFCVVPDGVFEIKSLDFLRTSYVTRINSFVRGFPYPSCISIDISL